MSEETKEAEGAMHPAPLNAEDAERIAGLTAGDKVKRAAMNKLVDYLMEDPETNIEKIMNMLDKVAPKNLFVTQRETFRHAIDDKGNWYQLLMKIMHLNPEVMPDLIKTFLVDSNLIAWGQQERNRREFKCNIPWAILLDPTSACNLHCTGCWAAEYGNKLNLTYDEIDSIINQGTELGVHMYIYTGGEPLVRKHDLIKLCEAHPDCTFLSFTNSTLIDEAFIQDMIRVKNFVPAISVEGIGEATDVRRGQGTFAKIDRAMTLLREAGLPFGVSLCHTSQNSDAMVSDEFFDWLIEQGALFAWIFTFMPVGYATKDCELMATPEQREQLYRFVQRARNEKPIFLLDFQNDGEFVGGCIAGGRRYLHINAKGDVEPCVFAHYSNANIREVPLLDALRSPLFMEYYRNQPFDGENLMRPCPIYENTGRLAEMVEASGAHSTDLEHAEDARDLTEKMRPRAEAWAEVAERLWNDPADPRHELRDRVYIGMAETDIEKFEELGHVGNVSLETLRAERSREK